MRNHRIGTKRRCRWLAVAYCIAAVCAAASAQLTPTVDMLVDDLASGDNARQARARQQLPLRGAEAAEKMLPLLNDDRDVVYYAAVRVFDDLIHETNRHGDDNDRARVANAVFSLLAPDMSERQKHVGLNTLPLAVNEDHGLAPAAALLLDAAFRERARASLETLGTPNAAAALCGALSRVDAAFQLALLRSLLVCEIDERAANALLPLLDDASPPVQAATLRALATTGDPALLPHARRIAAAADEDNALEAWDGWLRLADAIAARGGHWELAQATYREILDATSHRLVKSGAIVGMGRFGDATVIPEIVAALDADAEGQLEAAALEAFRNLHGRAAYQGLIEVLPRLSATMLPGMMAIFGDKADPLFLDILEQHARDADEHARVAAQAAIAASGLPQAASALQALLDDGIGTTAEREALTAYLYTLANTLRQQGDADGAGRAYLAIYRYTNNADMRTAALEGIRAFPVPEAYDIVLEMLAEDDVDSLPVSTMVGVALNAIEAGREAEGNRLMAEIMPRLTSADAVRHAIHAMRAHGPNPAFARALGYINRWWLVGPFPWRPQTGFDTRFIGEPDVSIEDAYTVDDQTLHWEQRESDDPAALFDLIAHLAPAENVVAFAYAEIEVAAGGPAQLRLGSDDGIRVWVNQEAVFQIDADRGYDIDQDVADITLREGRNVVLAQVTQLLGGWAFTLRLTEPDGKPLEFTIVE